MSTLGWEESIASIPFYPLWQMIVRIVLEAVLHRLLATVRFRGQKGEHFAW